MANWSENIRTMRALEAALPVETIAVRHDVTMTRYGVHKGSRKAVMRKALAATGRSFEPLLWEIRWNTAVDGTETPGKHTVTLGASYGPRA